MPFQFESFSGVKIKKVLFRNICSRQGRKTARKILEKRRE